MAGDVSRMGRKQNGGPYWRMSKWADGHETKVLAVRLRQSVKELEYIPCRERVTRLLLRDWGRKCVEP